MNADDSDDECLEFIVPETEPPGRLDATMARLAVDFSRSRLQAFIRDGHVSVNGATVTDPKHKVAAGAILHLVPPPAEEAEPQGEDLPLNVVYEDADLIVIDKPAGLVVHPAAGHGSGTLVNALIHHCGDSLSGVGGVKRPGIVHRLDKDTSGLIVVAKNDRTHHGLARQFADHGREGPLERAYLAIVWGAPARSRGIVEATLARSTRNREKIAVVSDERGKYALTRYQCLESFPSGAKEPLASLMRCELETGRTHQIRVHLSHIGHPLLGDATYGPGFKTKANRLDSRQQQALATLDRQALHAAVLGFAHPVTGETLRFESPLPEDMMRLLEALRGSDFQ